jgi:hypothetical protein
MWRASQDRKVFEAGAFLREMLIAAADTVNEKIGKL